jgi:DNA-binding transcriptional MocR family regulator
MDMARTTDGVAPLERPFGSGEAKRQQDFYTIAELAPILGVCTKTVSRRIKELIIRKAPTGGRIVRISPEEVARLAGF